MFPNDKVSMGNQVGCWATCHTDARTMPNADDKKTKGPQKRAVVDTSIVGEERIKALRAQAAKKVELERLKAAGIHLPADMFEGVTEVR